MQKFEDLFSINNLISAFYDCRKNNHWKESTHKYEANLMQNSLELHEELMSGNYRVTPKYEFTINERGKTRQIKAPALRDRVVQKILCNNVLIPTLKPYLIYDNYASLKDRGTALARKRMEMILREWISVNGSEGHIALIDIHDFFASIVHWILKQQYHEKIFEEERTMDLIDYSVDTSGEDGKGMNLGSEVPQISAIYYPFRMDNYFRIVKGNRTYGRYMDDTKMLEISKDAAHDDIGHAQEILGSLELELNMKKTQVVKISHGFTYLQTKYDIDHGKLITRPTHKKIEREKNKLRSYRHLLNEGKLESYDISLWYKAWRQGLLHDYNSCWKTVNSLDDYFEALFPEIGHPQKILREEMIKKAFKEARDEDLLYYRQVTQGKT